MKTKYLIDTCSLISLEEHYNPSNILFRELWSRVYNLLEREELLICSEVFEELKEGGIQDALKQYSKLFLPLSKEVQEKAKEILNEYPTLIKLQSKSNSNADPFLIATAEINNLTIITEELYYSNIVNDPNKYNIPKVCTKRNIKYMKLSEFINRDIFNTPTDR